MVVVGKNGKRMGTYALLDGGSTRHVISGALCEKLEIEGEKVKMCVTTLDQAIEGEREVADVEVVGVNGFQLDLNRAIFGRIIASDGDAPPKEEDVEDINHLRGIQFPKFDEGEVDERIRHGASKKSNFDDKMVLKPRCK